jgi:hypothetical protein
MYNVTKIFSEDSLTGLIYRFIMTVFRAKYSEHFKELIKGQELVLFLLVCVVFMIMIFYILYLRSFTGMLERRLENRTKVSLKSKMEIEKFMKDFRSGVNERIRDLVLDFMKENRKLETQLLEKEEKYRENIEQIVTLVQGTSNKDLVVFLKKLGYSLANEKSNKRSAPCVDKNRYFLRSSKKRPRVINKDIESKSSEDDDEEEDPTYIPEDD